MRLYSKYKRLATVIISFILLVLTACKKSFLDVEDNSVPIRSQYVEDLKTTGEYLNGIYILLGQNFYSAFHYVYPDLIADNAKTITGGTSLAAHYNWSQIAEDASGSGTNSMTGIWQYGYQIARACSFTIECTDRFKEENEQLSGNLKAQALSIRALVHLTMVNVYAQPYGYTPNASHTGIPYITSSDWTGPITRQTVSEVYERIVNDLNAAIPLFTASSGNAIIMNRYAAKALLARTYLYKGDYTNAKDQARDVSVSVPIMTGSNYPSKLFTPQETEALFYLPPSGKTGDSYTTIYAGRLYASPQRFLATADIAIILNEQATDLRKAWVNLSNLTVTKFPSGVVSGLSPASGSYYQTVLRSSEMYLTAAEAYQKLNNDDSARYFVNQIRTRAAIDPLSPLVTGTALQDSIYKERRRELAFEGLRMFDLLRWKQPVSRTDVSNGAQLLLPYPSNKAIAPIPLRDVAALGLIQNPGY